VTAAGLPVGGTAFAAAVRLLDDRHRPDPDVAPPWSGPAQPATPAGVPLATVDADFADAVPPEDRALAERILRLRRLDLRPVAPPATAALGSVPFALLVVGGLLSRSVCLGGRSTPELFGPGDVIDGADLFGSGSDDEVHWAVHQRSVLAVLDERFLLATRRWPGLLAVVSDRHVARARRLASHLAALQLSRVEDRVMAVLWQLADRWGRVTPSGVVLPVAITHEMLGRLVAARRPTVTLALSELAADGRLVRRGDGAWVLDDRDAPVAAGRGAAAPPRREAAPVAA
jgi:CRP-like cAMP-binding protein